MKKFEEAKKVYEEIEIPEELSGLVEETIEKHKKGNTNKRTSHHWHYSLASAAVLVICFTIALNTNATFAKTAENVPILGIVAKVLTVRSYEEKDNDKTTTVKVPAIENKEETSSGKIKDINIEIDKKVNEYVEQANEDIEEYKKAFLETGGTEAEWKEHDIHVDVNYEIKAQTEDYVSFVVTGYEDWNSSYTATYFYNIDLHTGNAITLKQLLGKDYIEKANQSIQNQIKEREKENKDVSYFAKEEGGFTTIKKDANFYINKKGNPVIVFQKYEIAAGYMGQQEFEVIQ